MQPSTFLYFCEVLRKEWGLENTNNIVMEEQVAMFLYIVGKHFDQRSICARFQHSLESVNHVRRVVRAVAKLGKHLMRPSNDDDLPHHIKFNEKGYPWFKDCVGAIEGTHVSAWVLAKKKNFRGRKFTVTQNVLCACNFNIEFTFVYSGWEGTANDSRVFLDAVTHPEVNFPWPRQGQYYIVDSGFPCTTGFPPYQGERYHLQYYRGRGWNPTSYKELFNYRHSSLRNVIERSFGILKARFPILKLMPYYKPVKQRIMVVVCCVVHNFI
ncbi:LOW QUALITY PROTEIN: DDE_4 domain-containing protein, partial [Cephalotus follicularis]